MPKYYICETCGNEFITINASEVTPMCCGKWMKELIPNTVENVALEKHVPVYKEQDNHVYVQVGSIPHPMEEKHYIKWVVLLTDQGRYIKKLHPGEKPEVVFAINDNEIVLSVLAYCNIHGLWEAKDE
jgi:superoxide reductase